MKIKNNNNNMINHPHHPQPTTPTNNTNQHKLTPLTQTDTNNNLTNTNNTLNNLHQENREALARVFEMKSVQDRLTGQIPSLFEVANMTKLQCRILAEEIAKLKKEVIKQKHVCVCTYEYRKGLCFCFLFPSHLTSTLDHHIFFQKPQS
jgi:hypothetical protein